MKSASVLLTLTSLIVIANCSNRSEPPHVPDNAPSGWQLKSITETSRQPRCAHTWRAEYAGPGIAHVNLCETGAGLDMAQNFRPAANTITFFNSHYFVLVNWEEVPRPALTALIAKLETTLK